MNTKEMDDDSSNDVQAIEADEPSKTEEDDSPIMKLFRRLTSNDTKQNTVLTNAQIVNILQKEFNVDINELHELELDICLNTIKKFLKEWPEWEMFDRHILNITGTDKEAELQTVLESNYLSLKKYLGVMLDTARSSAVELLNTVMEKERKKKDEDDKMIDVSLEVKCTRAQLNKLIFNHPNPKHSYSIFNFNDMLGPSKICLETIPLEAIINWWDVSISFSMPFLQFHRKTTHELKHVLINRKLTQKRGFKKVSTNLQEKGNRTKRHATSYIIATIKNISNIYCAKNDGNIELFIAIINALLRDLSLVGNISIQNKYRRYLNDYPYVRYLDTKIDGNNTKYDLSIEETNRPMSQFSVLRFCNIELKVDETVFDMKEVVEITCGMCNVKFKWEDAIEQLRSHFYQHCEEPPWQCPRCDKSFHMLHLAASWWRHDCLDEN